MYTKRKKKKKKISKKRKYIIILGVIAVALAIAIFSSFYFVLGSYNGLGLSKEFPSNSYSMDSIYYENGFMHYEDENYSSLVGIDVSTFQKKINWKKVKAAGVDFAMIRLGYRGATNGELFLDDRFEENLKGAKSAGIEVGVYFFAQTQSIEEAEEDAKFVIRNIRGRGVNGPVAFDMEPISNDDRIVNLTVKEKTEIADAFMTIIKRNGHYPVLYGNPTWLSNSVDISYLTEYSIWLAHYSEYTDYPYDYIIWQYSNTGKVNGISGNVDINIMFVKK